MWLVNGRPCLERGVTKVSLKYIDRGLCPKNPDVKIVINNEDCLDKHCFLFRVGKGHPWFWGLHPIGMMKIWGDLHLELE